MPMMTSTGDPAADVPDGGHYTNGTPGHRYNTLGCRVLDAAGREVCVLHYNGTVTVPASVILTPGPDGSWSLQRTPALPGTVVRFKHTRTDRSDGYDLDFGPHLQAIYDERNHR